MLTYPEGVQQRAKEEGLHLLKFSLNAKYAKRTSVSFAGVISDEAATKLHELLLFILKNRSAKPAGRRNKRRK